MANYNTGIISKNNILNVAKVMFYEGGYENTRFRKICLEAGINQGTLSYHYGSMENIAYTVYCELYENIVKIAQIACGEKKSKSTQLILTYILWWDIIFGDKHIKRFCQEITAKRIVQENDITTVYQNMHIYEEEFGIYLDDELKKMSAISRIGTENEMLINLDRLSLKNEDEIIIYLISIHLIRFNVSSQQIKALFYECKGMIEKLNYNIDYFQYFRYNTEYLPG